MTDPSRVIFNRVIDLRFTPRGGGQQIRYRFEGGRGLNIGFEVERKQRGRSNKAVITVQNLSPRIVGLIESGDYLVTLLAGYRTNAHLIFTGEIAPRSLVTERSGNTTTTRIEASASGAEIELTRFDRGFDEGVTVGLVLRSIVAEMGVGAGNLESLPGIDSITYATGASFYGPARTALDQVTARLGVTWSVQDGALQFLTDDQPLEEQAVLLSPGSGLIGAPKRVKGGVEGAAFMQRGIKPGLLVKIESETINAFYKLTETKDSGSYRTAAFRTEFKGKEIAS